MFTVESWFFLYKQIILSFEYDLSIHVVLGGTLPVFGPCYKHHPIQSHILTKNIPIDPPVNKAKHYTLKRIYLYLSYNVERHQSPINISPSERLKALQRANDKSHLLLITSASSTSYMNINQKKRIIRVFISSQFGYCPLAWFFCSRKINNRMNRIPERALRIVCKDYVSTFAQLLEKDRSVLIQIRNLQVHATEIFKARNNLSPPIVHNIFRTTEPAYSLRRDTIFESRRIQTQRYGIESLTNLGPKIWSQVPNEIKESASLAVFKNKIKNWRPKLCPCKLCKIYVVNLGYL